MKYPDNEISTHTLTLWVTTEAHSHAAHRWSSPRWRWQSGCLEVTQHPSSKALLWDEVCEPEQETELMPTLLHLDPTPQLLTMAQMCLSSHLLTGTEPDTVCHEICQVKTHLPTLKRKCKASQPTSPAKATWSCENTIVTLKSKSSQPRRDAQLYSSTRSGPLTTSDQRICHQNIQRWTYQDVRGIKWFWNCQTSALKNCLQCFWCTQKFNREYTLTKRHI